MKTTYLFAFALSLSVACGNPAADRNEKPLPTEVVARSELVDPPFAVRGEAEGLMLVWYDARGEAHTAAKRSEIPEEQRANVRVDALELAPEQRLDPDYVYVADLRAPVKGGAYAVHKVARATFESALASAGQQGETKAAGKADVILYGASWCGACKQARQYFTRKGVPFVEKDIEKEPGARSEMLAKARDQGVNASGIPVIDVRGRLVGGFNAARIEQLLTN